MNEILENSSKINGLVIEFHDFDLHYNYIQNFINKFELELIHIHVNNYGIIPINPKKNTSIGGLKSDPMSIPLAQDTNKSACTPGLVSSR